jgi:iron complex outermembrane recepter protein
MNSSRVTIRKASATSGSGSVVPRQPAGQSPWRHVPALVAAVLVCPAGAFAQDESSAQTVPSHEAPSEGALQEVVVTAQRRSESLQHAALSVTAVTPDELTKASVTSAADLTAVVPALQASNQSGYSAMYIRGIGSYSGNPYSEPAVAFNFDGVYVARANAVNGQFFDLERVEVLKGPQGTLYGRNATGGAVNLITHPAELGAFDGYVSAQYGNYNEILASGALNAPLGDKTAVRLAFQTEDHDGYMQDGTDDAKNRSARLSLRSEPTSDLSVNIVMDYSNLGGRGTGAAIMPLGTTPVRGGLGDPAAVAYYSSAAANSFIFPGAITPVPEYLSSLGTRIWGAMSNIELRTGVGTLTIVPAYREMNADNFLTTIGSFDWDRTRQQQVSIEARLASDNTGPFRYLVGAYYFDEHSDFDLAFDSQFIGVISEQGILSSKSPAAFTQLSYAITDAFRLTAGARYTEERKSLDGGHGVSPPAVFTSGPGLNPLNILPTPPEIIVDAARKFTSTTWKGGLEWDVAPQSLLYANVGTGFKAGGFFFAEENNSFKPEHVTSYTLGSKNRFFNDHLQLNAEAFLLKYRDQQFAHLGFVPGVAGPVSGYPTENVGRSTIKGAEVELQWLPIKGSLFGLNVQYVNSRYDQFTYQVPDISGLLRLPPGAISTNSGCPATLSGATYTVNCTGFQLLQTPTWTFNGTLQQSFGLSNGATLVAELRARYETSRWASDTFLPVSRIGGNANTDASLAYNSVDGHWSVTGYVDNIANRNIPGNVWANDVYPVFPLVTATLRPPRTFGVRGRYDF